MLSSQDQQFEAKGALWPFLKRIFKYTMRYKKWFTYFAIAIMFVATIDGIFPLIWKYYIDSAITPLVKSFTEEGLQLSSSEEAFKPIWKFVWIFFGVGAFSCICIWIFVRFTGYIQEHVMWSLRRDMFHKLQRLQFSFFDKNNSGWLLTRITSDTDRVTEMLSWGFLELVWGITMIVIGITMMLFLQWKLAIMVALTIPILILVSFKIRLLILKYSRKTRKINSELTSNYSENIHGVAVNKSLAQEYQAGGRFRRLSSSMKESSYRAQYYTAMYSPLVIFIGSMATVGVIIWGGSMTQSLPPGMTIGDLMAFFGFTTMIFMPILDIARFYALAQGSLSAGERIFGLLDEPVLIKDHPNAKQDFELKGEIEFKGVEFGYLKGQSVLKGLDLHISAGESVALVGPTGEGKTTIANLMARFYEPREGAILLDGTDYATLAQARLREQMGIVLQSPHLFSGTIKDNILFAKPNASDQEIKDSLIRLGAEELFARLDEEVGEGGEHLSLGEKQMVSFARAVIVDPRVLIMDEATSSVDTLTETKIQQGVQALLKDRTAIIIAHRLSTIRSCDKIVVIGEGAIRESGSHQELMRKKGKYFELYTRQLRSELEPQSKPD